MLVSGYTLELYCDNTTGHSWVNDPDSKGVFTSDANNCKSVAFKMARANGWKIKRNGECLCPKCNAKTTTIVQVDNNEPITLDEFIKINSEDEDLLTPEIIEEIKAMPVNEHVYLGVCKVTKVRF